jgi:hypothetical protein
MYLQKFKGSIALKIHKTNIYKLVIGMFLSFVRKSWSPLLTSPLAPRGELYPQGWTWPLGGKCVP